jgi:hypothetical protein
MSLGIILATNDGHTQSEINKTPHTLGQKAFIMAIVARQGGSGTVAQRWSRAPREPRLGGCVL